MTNQGRFDISAPEKEIPKRTILMLKKRLKPMLIGVFAVCLFAKDPANAAISISNLMLTEHEVRFTLSGTLVGATPSGGQRTLFFVNSNANASAMWIGPTYPSFQSSPLSPRLDSFIVGGIYAPYYGSGNFFELRFYDDLMPGQAFSGNYSARWVGGPMFEPDKIPVLDVYWGVNSISDTPGIFQTSANVIPEPSSVALICLGAWLALYFIRRKNTASTIRRLVNRR